MAASPLVVPSSNPLLKTAPSPLRRQTSAHPSSANGTPQASRPAGQNGQNGQGGQTPMMDLAEQMNLEERRKYVKGMIQPLPIPLRH